MTEKLEKTQYGYYSIVDLPSKEDLEKHYALKYYQDGQAYSHQYTQDELQYFKNTAEVALYIYQQSCDKSHNSLLEIGAGEGFFANNFLENKWDITTLDYSEFGMKQHNPSLLNTLIQGDMFNSLDKLIVEKNKFDMINLSNVLEHVLDPIDLLSKLKQLLSNNSLLRISVPNDYSDFQQFLLDKKYTTNTWFVPPEHLHYFTFSSLVSLLESIGYDIVMQLGEFPIELYLTNESSNYNKKDVGQFAHKSRVEVDNFLFETGIEKYINFYKASADIGLSRQVVIYAKVKNK